MRNSMLNIASYSHSFSHFVHVQYVGGDEHACILTYTLTHTHKRHERNTHMPISHAQANTYKWAHAKRRYHHIDVRWHFIRFSTQNRVSTRIQPLRCTKPGNTICAPLRDDIGKVELGQLEYYLRQEHSNRAPWEAAVAAAAALPESNTLCCIMHSVRHTTQCMHSVSSFFADVLHIRANAQQHACSRSLSCGASTPETSQRKNADG